MSEIVYRQRLTGLGWLGALLFVGGQIIGGVAFKGMMEASMRPYGDANTPALIVVACGIAIFSGLIMVLVGREYYPFTAPESDEPEYVAPTISQQSDLNRRIEEHFGKPIE